MEQNIALELKNITKVFGSVVANKNVSLQVRKGEILSILGENGSGKSSLLKTLLSLKAPSEGRIIFENGLRRDQIGYLPQITPQQKDFPASALEVVLSGCLNKMGLKPFYGKKEKALAQKNMELLNVYNLKGECFRTLSGGQKQRVLLARALCSAGKMLLLDEPVAGLDPLATRDFYEAIDHINKNGVCIIMVSHDTDASLPLAKHVLDIGNHTAQFFGTREEYIKSK